MHRTRSIVLANHRVGKSDQILSQVKGLVEQNRPPPMLQWGNSRETLANLLAADEEATQRNVTFIQRQAQSIEEREQRQALWLFQSPRFESWLCANRSDVILVDGNSERHGMARYSAMSLVSSALVQELNGNHFARTISFFCGLHNLPNDDMAGPQGLMRSLVAQLLSMSDMGCDVHLASSHLDAVSRHDVGALCDLLHQLLTRNRLGTILFCIVDGISLFEVDGWRDDVQLVAWRLVGLAADPRLGATFKLIMTSPGATRHVKNCIDASNRIWVPRDAISSARIEGMSQQASTTFASAHGGSRNSSQSLTGAQFHDNIYEYGCE
jgi:hypothetical protein